MILQEPGTPLPLYGGWQPFHTAGDLKPRTVTYDHRELLAKTILELDARMASANAVTMRLGTLKITNI